METTVERRVMPHDTEAEKALIGALMMNNEKINVVEDILQKDDFYNAQFGIIFDAVLRVFHSGNDADPITVSDKLSGENLPEEIGSIQYLTGIVLSVPSSSNAVEYATIIKNKATLRNLIKVSEKISNDCYLEKDEVDAILENAEKEVYDVIRQKNNSSDFESMDEIVLRTLEGISEAAKNKGRLNGLATGFIDLDYRLTGLHKGELLIVAARPSMGKTAFVLNIAHYVSAKSGFPVAFFSLEMPKEQLVSRMVAMDAEVDSQNLKTGEIGDSDWRRILEGTDRISNAPLFIDDNSSITVSMLRSKCRKLKNSRGLSLIIIDYLQLMSSASQRIESRQQFISDVSRSLKSIARELEVPVIALSQLNRAVDSRNDHKPVLADLRESGAIEQDADVVMFIYRDDFYNKEDSERKGIADIIVAKQRNGAIGTVELLWDSKYTKFRNMEHSKNN